MTDRAGEQVLVLQAGGRRLAVPVAELLGVAPADIRPLPLAEEAHLGLMRHQQSVFPVFDPLRLVELGAMRTAPQLVVLMECHGCVLGLACHRVEGSGPLEGPREEVREGLEWRVAGWPVLLLDLVDTVLSRARGG